MNQPLPLTNPQVNSPDPTEKKSVYFLIIGVAVVVMIVGFTTLVFMKRQLSSRTTGTNNEQAQVPPTPTPSPTPTPKPLPKGKQVYNFSHGKDVTGPKPTQAIVLPIDPKPGQEQSVTITVSHPTEITTNSLTLITDTQTRQYPLTKLKQDGEATVWQAKWQASDTYQYRYEIKFTFSDGESTFDGGLTIR